MGPMMHKTEKLDGKPISQPVYPQVVRSCADKVLEWSDYYSLGLAYQAQYKPHCPVKLAQTQTP